MDSSSCRGCWWACWRTTQVPRATARATAARVYSKNRRHCFFATMVRRTLLRNTHARSRFADQELVGRSKKWCLPGAWHLCCCPPRSMTSLRRWGHATVSIGDCISLSRVLANPAENPDNRSPPGPLEDRWAWVQSMSHQGIFFPVSFLNVANHPIGG